MSSPCAARADATPLADAAPSIVATTTTTTQAVGSAAPSAPAQQQQQQPQQCGTSTSASAALTEQQHRVPCAGVRSADAAATRAAALLACLFLVFVCFVSSSFVDLALSAFASCAVEIPVGAFAVCVSLLFSLVCVAAVAALYPATRSGNASTTKNLHYGRAQTCQGFACSSCVLSVTFVASLHEQNKQLRCSPYTHAHRIKRFASRNTVDFSSSFFPSFFIKLACFATCDRYAIPPPSPGPHPFASHSSSPSPPSSLVAD